METKNLIKLIENARVENYVYKIIQEKGFEHENGEINYEACYKYFLENFKDELSLYKLKKHNGYDCIILFKNVVMVGSADFYTQNGREMESNITKIAEDWPVYQTVELKREILKRIFANPWDKRKKHEYKPTAEKVWGNLKEILL